ncbi:MAG: twin-arginine translocase subunit TatC [Bdellovibrio sp.]|nr:MAG: twin-arginine translocase subunit TatC [Bdellovibrio sp.]
MSELDSMPLTEHLRELRTRIIRSFGGILLATLVCYYFSDKIFEVLREPIRKYLPTGGLVFTAPVDKFMAFLKVSFFAGLIASCPWWLFQIWQFVAPGLYAKEKKYGLIFISSGTVLFMIGVCFAYFLAVPAAFEFLMTFGGDADKPMITIDHYLSFLTTFLVMFGMAFELPLVIVILGMMGIVSQEFLRSKRRYIIVILSIVSAIVTPPDVISMTIMLVPLYLLFEISVLIVGRFERQPEGSA